MTNLKQLVFKFLLLIPILVCLNFVYKKYFFENDIQTHSPILNIVRDAVNSKSEIVYVGESSNFTFRRDDFDKRSISDFVSDYYPSKKMGAIIKEASHAGIYYELLRNIPENSTVKTVIVTMNLRSFDAGWIYSNLETPLQKSLVLIKDNPPLFNRFLLAFKAYDIKSDSEREQQFRNAWKKDILKFPYPFKYNNVIDWDYGMAQQKVRNANGTINQPLTELACHYIKTYAFQIDTLNNPRIKDFDKIVALAKQRNWHLVFNLMAENIEMADSLVGKEIPFFMRQNTELLMKRYNKNNVNVVNNLEDVLSEEFIDQNWTTEHYAEKGRRIIAKNVAECLKKIYPNDYKTPPEALVKLGGTNDKNISVSNEFSNDCEGQTVWGQMQTLSSDKAHSGSKSSRTGQKNDYSVTWEYPIKNISDSIKKVNVSFQLFQNDFTDKANLAIEISGNSFERQWNGKLIKDLSQATNSWSEINYTFPLPDNFHKAELIKVYVVNPSNTLIYIDDIKIKLQK